MPAAGLPADRHFQNSDSTPERGGVQRTDRAVTTCRLPHYRGMPTSSMAPINLSTTLMHIGNYPYPPGTPTLRIDKQG